MKLRIERWYRELGTYGDLFVMNDLEETILHKKTLELPWKNNQRNESCIPEGIYNVIKMAPTVKRPYIYFLVKDVPGRNAILFHPGNYTSDILGCILPGERITDINEDGILDITNTTSTLKMLVDLLPDSFELEIAKAEES